MGDTPDFGDTGYIEDTATGAGYLDASLADLLAELESITIHQAAIETATLNIEGATVAVDLPFRFRTGSPVFLERWEYDQPMWSGDSSGSDGATGRSATAFWSKGYSYELKCSSDSTRRATVTLKQGGVVAGKMGLYFAFTLHTRTDYLRVEWYFINEDGGYEPEIKFDYNGKEIEILTETDGWVSVASWDFFLHAATQWNFAKVVLDTSTGMWDTLYINEEEVDISAYDLPVASGYKMGMMWLEFGHYGEVDYNAIAYLDDICITTET